MKIGIIIPIHNYIEETKKFLVSLYSSLLVKKHKWSFKIIIVDDGSTDGSAEWIHKHYPEIKVITGDGNLFWSESTNVGVRYAIKIDCNRVLLFNNDNILEENYFIELDRALQKFNSDVVITSKVYNLYPKINFQYAGINCDYDHAKFINGFSSAEEIKETDVAGGMGVLISVSVFRKIGFFDSVNFPQVKGDFDFYLRAKKKGINMYYYPKLVVYNNNKITGYKTNNNLRELINSYVGIKAYYNIKNDIIFYFRHFSVLPAIRAIFVKHFKFIGGFIKRKIGLSKSKNIL